MGIQSFPVPTAVGQKRQEEQYSSFVLRSDFGLCGLWLHGVLWACSLGHLPPTAVTEWTWLCLSFLFSCFPSCLPPSLPRFLSSLLPSGMWPGLAPPTLLIQCHNPLSVDLEPPAGWANLFYGKEMETQHPIQLQVHFPHLSSFFPALEPWFFQVSWIPLQFPSKSM